MQPIGKHSRPMRTSRRRIIKAARKSKASILPHAAVQANYQLTKTSYAALGVPASRLFLGEDYSQTTAGTDYGRSGVSMDDWNEAIEVRSQAIHNVGFYGSISYDWGKDAMGVLEDEMIQYEQTYRAQILP